MNVLCKILEDFKTYWNKEGNQLYLKTLNKEILNAGQSERMTIIKKTGLICNIDSSEFCGISSGDQSILFYTLNLLSETGKTRNS